MPVPVVAFAAAFLLTFLLTPVVRRLALRAGAVKVPVARSVHSQPVPHLGGVAMFIAFAVAVVLVEGWPSASTARIIGCGLLALLLGAADDLRDLSPRTKLVGQVLVASLVVAAGVHIHFVTNPLGGFIYFGLWSYPISVLWIVAVMNVVNLADGLDGLAAGICAIAALAALVVAIKSGMTMVVPMAAALAGATIGFLPHNFNPAKIFMGDAGSMFLGFALAVISAQGALKQTTAVALLVPVIALGLPIADTVMAIIRRLRAGRSIGQADKGHIHHQLLDLGLSQKKAVLLMWAVTAWLAVSGVLVSVVGQGLGLVLVLVMAVLGLFAFIGVVTAGTLAQNGKNVPK